MPRPVFSLDIPEIFSSERRSRSVPARHSLNGKTLRYNFLKCFREIESYSEGDYEDEFAKLSPNSVEEISPNARSRCQNRS